MHTYKHIYAQPDIYKQIYYLYEVISLHIHTHIFIKMKIKKIIKPHQVNGVGLFDK